MEPETEPISETIDNIYEELREIKENDKKNDKKIKNLNKKYDSILILVKKILLVGLPILTQIINFLEML